MISFTLFLPVQVVYACLQMLANTNLMTKWQVTMVFGKPKC